MPFSAKYAAVQIALLDEGDPGECARSWHFRLDQGSGYIMSGNARNKCLHGVIADGPDTPKIMMPSMIDCP